MRLGYIIIYVSNVPNTVAFYETAFALTCQFIHEGSLYAEMETGSTTLAFAGHEAAEMIGLKVFPNDPKALSAGWKVCLIADDVAAAYEHAVAKRCNPVAPPTENPWGQTVSYLRDLDGCLVETASPIAPKD